MEEDLKSLIGALKDLVDQLKDQNTRDGVVEGRTVDVEDTEAFQQAFADRKKKQDEEKDRQELIDGIGDRLEESGDDGVADPQRKILEKLMNVNVMNFDPKALDQLAGVIGKSMTDDLKEDIAKKPDDIPAWALGLGAFGALAGLGAFDRDLITLGGIITKLSEVTKAWRASKIEKLLTTLRSVNPITYLNTQYTRLVNSIKGMFNPKVLKTIINLARVGFAPLSIIGGAMTQLFGKAGVFSGLAKVVTKIPGMGLATGFIKGAGGILKKLLWPVTVIMSTFDFITGFMEGYDQGGVLQGISTGLKKMIKNLIFAPLDLVKSAISTVTGWLGFDQAEKWLDSFSFESMFTEFWDWTESLFNDMLKSITSYFRDVTDIRNRDIAKKRSELRAQAIDETLIDVIGSESVKKVQLEQKIIEEDDAEDRRKSMQKNTNQFADLLRSFRPPEKATEEEKIKLLTERIESSKIDPKIYQTFGDKYKEQGVKTLLRLSEEMKSDDQAVAGRKFEYTFTGSRYQDPSNYREVWDFDRGAAKELSDMMLTVSSQVVTDEQNKQLEEVVTQELKKSDQLNNILTTEERAVIESMSSKIQQVSNTGETVTSESFDWSEEQKETVRNVTEKISQYQQTLQEKINKESTTAEQKQVLEILYKSVEELKPIEQFKSKSNTTDGVIDTSEEKEMALKRAEQQLYGNYDINDGTTMQMQTMDGIQQIESISIPMFKKSDQLDQQSLDMFGIEEKPKPKTPPEKTIEAVREVTGSSVVPAEEAPAEVSVEEQRKRLENLANLLTGTNIKVVVENRQTGETQIVPVDADPPVGDQTDAQSKPVVVPLAVKEITDKSKLVESRQESVISTGSSDSNTFELDNTRAKPDTPAPEAPKSENPPPGQTLEQFFSEPVSNNINNINNRSASESTDLYQHGDVTQYEQHGGITTEQTTTNIVQRKQSEEIKQLGKKFDKMITLMEQQHVALQATNEHLKAQQDDSTGDVNNYNTRQGDTINNTTITGDSTIVSFRNKVIKGLV